MAKAGRKRKAGQRTKSGQLSRAKGSGNPLPNAPSEWVKAQRAMFGSHYNTALGRAYASGLLGEGNEGKTRLDAGNRFVVRYSRVFGSSAYTCPLDRTPRGMNDNADRDPERDRRNQDWMFAITKRLDEQGLRPWLDQLIHRNYTDTGPHWLDALLNARWNAHNGHWRAGAPHGQASDLLLLSAALKALDCIAGIGDREAEQPALIPFNRMRAVAP